MKSMKMALLAGAAVAVSTAVAHADELADMKAQIETLNARVAAMETAPSVPAARLVSSLRSAPLTPGCTNSMESDVAAGAPARSTRFSPTRPGFSVRYTSSLGNAMAQ